MSDREAKPLEPKTEPLQMTTVPRLPFFPQSIDVGEQVVGSGHWFHVNTPRNLSLLEGTNTGQATIEGPSVCRMRPPNAFEHGPVTECTPGHTPFLSEWNDPRSLDQREPLRVGFAPAYVGRYTALLRFIARWSDGRTDERVVSLQGSARALNDPAANRPQQPHHEPMKREAPQKSPMLTGIDPALLTALYNEATTARDNAEQLAKQQELGLGFAEKNAQAYKKAIPEAPWWLDLAQLAVMMGVAGIAGVVAKSLANRLAGGAHKVATEQVGIDYVDPDLSGTKIVAGLTDSIKEGMKTSAKLAMAAAAPSSPKPQGKPVGGTYSSDRRIEFFAQQSVMLAGVGDKNRRLITDKEQQLQPLLRTNPTATLTAMRVIGQALRSADVEAIKHQQRATEAQWTVAVARSTLGSGVAGKNPDGSPIVTTPMKSARNGRTRDGVLTIEIHVPTDDVNNPNVQFQVRGASIHGVSQSIADHLREMDLHALPMPVMIEIRGAVTARISRDEAGVVRVTGDFPRREAEAQHIRGATMLFERVIAKPLAAWGVARVKTDDEGGAH